MPPINGIGNLLNSLSGNGNAPFRFSVALPSATPTRAQVADAYFGYFGFKRSDAAFIKQHAGTDLFAHFERNFQLTSGSIKQIGGHARITLEADAKTLATMRELAKLHHAPPPSTPSPTTAREAMQVKQGFDSSALLKARLNQQLDRQIASQQPVAQPPPLPLPPPTPPAKNAQASADTEGIGAFFEGAVKGSFSNNDSWSSIGGQTAIGFVPILGQIADARDIAAAAKQVFNGKPGAWGGLSIAAIAVIPGLDFLKGGSRVGRKVLKEVAEEGLSSVAQSGLRHLGTKVSQAGIERAGKELITLSVAREEMLGRLEHLARDGNLSQNAQGVIAKVRNGLRDHATQDDLIGALRDNHGLPVLDSSGRAFDHIGEVQRDVLTPLNKARETLIKELDRYTEGTDDYSRLSSEIDALSETRRRIADFLEIK